MHFVYTFNGNSATVKINLLLGIKKMFLGLIIINLQSTLGILTRIIDYIYI